MTKTVSFEVQKNRMMTSHNKGTESFVLHSHHLGFLGFSNNSDNPPNGLKNTQTKQRNAKMVSNVSGCDYNI